MSKRDRAPHPIVTLTAKGLSPASAYDLELLDGDAFGSEYDLVKRSKRSNPQNALYWKALSRIVRATDKWPTPVHLHEELKFVCGYRRQMIDWQTGKLVYITDSTAFDKMTHDEFKAYFDLAMQKLAEYLGHDPLDFYQEAA